MRSKRVLLFVVTAAAAAAFAGAYASSASALAFADLPCPITPPATLKVCPNGETGKAYGPLHVDGRAGTGCYPNVKYSVVGGTALPTGLSLSSDGWISGTPTTAGKYDFWLQMQDTNGTPSWCTDSEATQREFEITIVQGLQIVERQSTLAPAQVNVPYNLQLHFTGGGSPGWSVSSGSLPAGLSLNASTGLISGTPTTTADTQFQIKISDGTRSDVQTYSLSVVQPLKITSTVPPGAELGQPFNMTLAATGGKSGYTWSLASGSSLPAGLTLDPAKGTITGTPTASGKTAVKLAVTDSLGLHNTVDLNIAVAAQLAIVKHPLRVAKVGRVYRARLYASGGVAPRTWTILRGTLPTGIRLHAATGALTGTPTKAGRARLTFEVTDKLGVVSKMTFVLKVTP